MNTIITSREAILQECREFVAQNGLQTLNMRILAKQCGISVGSLYHYFPSKSELTAAVIQDIWQDIFQVQEGVLTNSFLEYVEWIFEKARMGTEQYPNFFTMHSLSFANMEKTEAKQVMETYFKQMKVSMLDVLNQDNSVLPEKVSEHFTKEAFVDFVFYNLLGLLTKQKCSCSFLLEVIQRCLYQT